MQINERQIDDVTILDLQGKLVIGTGESALRESVQKALEDGNRHMLFNMREVTAIDSSGIGEMISAYTMASNQGARVVLCNLPRKIEDILRITHLITVFEVYESEEEALLAAK